ncbi:Vms1/Ankzf1 family peptidyl-tRNA hydrolase [Catenulispora subtropica]|uniref:Peptide chain release factor 1 n=1 Tax=Catenulispora subtropica TaxID=450798 RepID=A0ABN2SI65_9ACTN
MTTALITENPVIHDLYDLPAPVLTAYLNSPFPGPGVDDTALRRKALLGELRSAHATPDALEAMDGVLSSLEPGEAPAAAFVGGDGRVRLFSLPGARVGDQGYVAAVPHVLPFLEWRQQHPAFAVVMLDRTGAELVVHPAGAGRPVRATVAGPDDVIERNAPGGWSQGRYQNRAEDSWQHNAGRAAEAVGEALKAAQARLLIVGGDVRAQQYFLDQLPGGVREVAIKSISGGRGPDGSEQHRAEVVEALVQEHVNDENRSLLDRVRNQSAPGGLGVLGPAATIHALSRAQVRVLLLSRREAGTGETEPTTAWFGPRPTDVSEHRNGVLVPDGNPSHGPLQEVLARAAVLTDADIRILPPNWADEASRGIGALCRFAVS